LARVPTTQTRRRRTCRLGLELLENFKPTDAMIVGMYQQFGDQAGANAGLVRELCSRFR
jgi:hypothetical protein